MRQARPSFFLLLLCLGLGWLVYQEGKSEARRLSPRPSMTPSQTLLQKPPPLADFVLAPLDDFVETANRPLFMPTRRPPDPDQVEPVQPAQKSLPIKVIITGVIISDEARFALVQRERSGEVLRLAPGDEIDGWKVDAVLSDRVVFRRGEEVVESELRDRAKPKRTVKPKRRKARQPTAPSGRNRAKDRETEASPGPAKKDTKSR